MNKRVLILCTGNSCRSQMAEALWESLGADQWQSASAGSKPAGYVHRLAVKAMRELGIDISSNTSKSLEQFQDEAFNVIVTVRDNAQEACPVFPGASETLHWPFAERFIESGGKVLLCPHCAKSARVGDLMLKQNAEIGTEQALGKMLLEADKILDY